MDTPTTDHQPVSVPPEHVIQSLRNMLSEAHLQIALLEARVIEMSTPPKTESGVE